MFGKWRLFCLGLNVLTDRKLSTRGKMETLPAAVELLQITPMLCNLSPVSDTLARFYRMLLEHFAGISWPNLTHWGRVTHICVSKLSIVGSDNGLSPDRRQSIIWTNAGILLIRPLGTKFNEILIEIHIFIFKKIRLKVSSAKRRPFCLGLNVLTDSKQRQNVFRHAKLTDQLLTKIVFQ